MGADTIELTVSPDEAGCIRALVAEVLGGSGEVGEGSADRAAIATHELPRGVRQAMTDFRLDDAASACVVRGLPIDEGALGPTPSHWSAARSGAAEVAAEALLVLIASLLGDVVAWSTKHGGRLVHNIAPSIDDADEQLASSSSTPLTWHSEDAFHPLRADYLGLLCLRNPASTPTLVGSVTDLELPGPVRDLLFEQRFAIMPDDSHSTIGAGAGRPVALLFGHPEAPYLRLDECYARPYDPSDEEARVALASLCTAMEAALKETTLSPGDLVLIDNLHAVHGRPAFPANHDGRDRWLKRVNVVRDVRRSRSARSSARSRVVQG